MPKENLERRDEFDLTRTLAPQTKMRMLLEIFEIGPDKEKNGKRKNKFIELLGKYHQASKSSQKSEVGSSITYNEVSDKNKKNGARPDNGNHKKHLSFSRVNQGTTAIGGIFVQKSQ